MNCRISVSSFPLSVGQRWPLPFTAAAAAARAAAARGGGGAPPPLHSRGGCGAFVRSTARGARLATVVGVPRPLRLRLLLLLPLLLLLRQPEPGQG
jgi:hypothetical protein